MLVKHLTVVASILFATHAFGAWYVTQEGGIDRRGSFGDYKNFDMSPGSTASDCANICLSDPICRSYAYVYPGCQNSAPRCWLKSVVQNTYVDEFTQRCVVGGYKYFTNPN